MERRQPEKNQGLQRDSNPRPPRNTRAMFYLLNYEATHWEHISNGFNHERYQHEPWGGLHPQVCGPIKETLTNCCSILTNRNTLPSLPAHK